ILSPLLTDMPVWATSPLTLTRPSAMRCSSARREPRPAWARTLCRRSSSLNCSDVASRLSESLFNEGLRGVSLISFAPADGFEVGLWFGIGLVNSHGRLRDGVVFAFVHCHRALARRGI